MSTRETTAEELRAEGHELIARGHAKLAAAERLAKTTASACGLDWVRVDTLPIPKKAALAACRSGVLPAVKKGRVWLARRADADAFLATAPNSGASANDVDEVVRAALGLSTRRSA